MRVHGKTTLLPSQKGNYWLDTYTETKYIQHKQYYKFKPMQLEA